MSYNRLNSNNPLKVIKNDYTQIELIIGTENSN